MRNRISVRFVGALLSLPHLIEPRAGHAVVRFLLPDARLQSDFDEEEAGQPRDTTREFQMIRDLAVIPIVGELVHRGSWMDAASGVQSYSGIEDMVTSALRDHGVGSVVLDVDSPGGEGAGCLDMARRLREAIMASDKPVTAVVNAQASSAAYAIASAAKEIVIPRTGIAGSIGVITYHADLSKLLDKAGVEITTISAGARKADGAPWAPLSDPAMAAMQAKVDTFYSEFCELVASNRGLSVDAVRGTEAGTFMGQDAIKAGLADRLSTLEETVSIMAQQPRVAVTGARLAAPEGAHTDPLATPSTPPEGTNPPNPPAQEDGTEPGQTVEDAEQQRRKNPPASPVPAPPKDVMEACHDAGYPFAAMHLVREQASAVRVQTRLDELKAIDADCKRLGLVGWGEMAAKHNLTREAARELGFGAKATAGDATVIDSGHMLGSNRPASLNAAEIYTRFNASPAPRQRA